ncbi:MAG: DUF167 domain-containing protein [Candidatus Saganbacteria bacterium]|nr:DUF167 domain-containing protein [Candidatus Saganbacteria bacterium]
MKLNIRVITKAKHQKIVKEEGRLKVYLTVPPIDGKANKALIKLLAEYFGVKKSRVRIIKGLKSRDKIIEL